jgi:hypothetical protein
MNVGFGIVGGNNSHEPARLTATRTKGIGAALVTILAARGIAIADQVRARIAECTDPDLLERWATRAAISTTIDEVFAS